MKDFIEPLSEVRGRHIVTTNNAADFLVDKCDVKQHNVSTLDEGIAAAIIVCHDLARNAGWWSNQDGTPKDRNDGEMIALMHSELSEALEGVRKSIPDSHLPHRRSVEVELADLLIRVFDYAGARGLDIGAAMIEKMAYNAHRADHKPEARAAVGGKKF